MERSEGSLEWDPTIFYPSLVPIALALSSFISSGFERSEGLLEWDPTFSHPPLVPIALPLSPFTASGTN